MKSIILATIMSISSIYALAQTKDIDINEHFQFTNRTDTTSLIYISALWCKPCIDKMPYLEAYFKYNPGKFKLTYLFDRDHFNFDILKKIFRKYSFFDRLYLFADSLYPNGFIQINGHKRAFKNMRKMILKNYPDAVHVDSLNLAAVIVMEPGKPIRIVDTPLIDDEKNGEDASYQQIAAFMDRVLRRESKSQQ